MPTFDREALRKGREAIHNAVANRGKGGDFRPFLSNIYWKKDKDFRYVLFLTPMEESLQVLLHPYLEVDGRPNMTMARTDRSFGGTADPIQERWGYKPRVTNLAIAVELEPMMKVVNGREKPTGFEVKTVTFERRVRDDDGELTDEREEVSAPVVGLVAQSPHNFFMLLDSYDNTEAPVHTTPLKITRVGDGSDLSFGIIGYDGVEVDRTNLLEYIENLGYVTDGDELLEAIDGLDDVEASTVIGDYLLNRRIDELADEDLYNEILEGITKPSPWADKKGSKKEDKKPARQARPSQRRKPEDTSDDGEGEKVTRSSPAAERLAQLKQKSREAAKKS